jgi:hypothetical protein
VIKTKVRKRRVESLDFEPLILDFFFNNPVRPKANFCVGDYSKDNPDYKKKWGLFGKDNLESDYRDNLARLPLPNRA